MIATKRLKFASTDNAPKRLFSMLAADLLPLGPEDPRTTHSAYEWQIKLREARRTSPMNVVHCFGARAILPPNVCAPKLQALSRSSWDEHPATKY